MSWFFTEPIATANMVRENRPRYLRFATPLSAFGLMNYVFVIFFCFCVHWAFSCQFSVGLSVSIHYMSKIYRVSNWGIIQGLHKRMVQFQKLTRNLFLTLHEHSVHRQQRQLSKFLMRYQQFASHAYCGASFQDGVAAGKGFLCAPFWVVQICDHSARNARCTVITDLDISKRSTQKAFSCSDAILETGPAVSMRSELLVSHEKLGHLPLLTVYVVPV